MKFKLLIVTPYKKYLDQEVDSIVLTTSVGQITVLPGHDDLIGNVDICPLKIENDGVIKYYAIGNGSISIDRKANTVYLILSSIESSEEINLEQAVEEKRIAEGLLIGAKTKKEMETAEFKLKKALTRINLKEGQKYGE